jgi:hypothetical protein
MVVAHVKRMKQAALQMRRQFVLVGLSATKLAALSQWVAVVVLMCWLLALVGLSATKLAALSQGVVAVVRRECVGAVGAQVVLRLLQGMSCTCARPLLRTE